MFVLNSRFACLLFVAAIVLGLQAGFLDAAEKATAVKIKGETVSYIEGNKAVKGFLAQPVKEGKYPAVILIHEWWGLNDYIRDNARKFAELGYVVLAVDLYDGQSTTDRGEARKLATKVRGDQKAAMDHLKQAVDF